MRLIVLAAFLLATVGVAAAQPAPQPKSPTADDYQIQILSNENTNYRGQIANMAVRIDQLQAQLNKTLQEKNAKAAPRPELKALPEKKH